MRNIDDKVDSIVEVLNNHTVILTEIQKDVEYHIKRTDLLESQVNRQDEQLGEAIKPIQWFRITGTVLKWVLPFLVAYFTWLKLRT